MMANFKFNSSSDKKYSHPAFWLHYVLLLAVLYYFGVDAYLKYLKPLLISNGFNLSDTVQILMWSPTLDAVFMAVFFFVVLVVGDIVIHLVLDGATGRRY